LPAAKGRDDRRLIDVTMGELLALIDQAVQRAMGGREADETKVSAKQAAKALKTSEKRVRDWCRDGCPECGEKLPHTMAGDVKGILIYVSQAREWEKRHRGPEGCRD
jgi:hypothetical protein